MSGGDQAQELSFERAAIEAAQQVLDVVALG
jgi:hypothetical protein